MFAIIAVLSSLSFWTSESEGSFGRDSLLERWRCFIEFYLIEEVLPLSLSLKKEIDKVWEIRTLQMLSVKSFHSKTTVTLQESDWTSEDLSEAKNCRQRSSKVGSLKRRTQTEREFQNLCVRIGQTNRISCFFKTKQKSKRRTPSKPFANSHFHPVRAFRGS